MHSSQAWRREPSSFGRAGRHWLVVLGALCLAQQAGANPVYKCERMKETYLNVDRYYPSAINDAGEVAGTGIGFVAVKWDKRREGLVLTKDMFAMATYVNGINKDGVTVGASNIEGPHPEGLTAYKWLPDGSFVKLTRLPGQHTFAEDVNDAGVVAGWSTLDGLATATLWTDAGQTKLPALESGKNAYASHLNNGDVVVGEAMKTVDGQEVVRAVRWRNGKVRDLGTLQGMNSSTAHALNDRGLIVGVSMDSAAPNSTAPVAWVDGVIHALNTSGSTAGSAVNVNRRGEIVGYTSALGPTYWADVNASPLKVADLISADKPCRGSEGQAVQVTGAQDINAHGSIVVSGLWTKDDGSTVVRPFRLVPMAAR